MNAKDREQVAEILGELEGLKAKIEEQGNALRELADAEQEKFDNMSEGLQQSEQGQKIEANAGALSEAADSAEQSNVDEAIEALGNIEE
jgi:L-rhamnose isomerase